MPAFVHRPYLVVTMADLWQRFEQQLAGSVAGRPTLSRPSSSSELVALEERLPGAAAIIGLGGGQALDVAKFLAWTRRLPLFQVPTATTVNAPFGHRAGVRDEGRVRYVGWAVPEAVYIDFEVIGRRRRTSTGRGRRRALLPHGPVRLAARRPARAMRGALAVRRRLAADAATVMGWVVDASTRSGPAPRPGSGPSSSPSLGRDHVPRLRLEPAPHRGRGALRLLQPRADHRPPLHPRPAGRAGDHRGVRAAGQRARRDGRRDRPRRRRHPAGGDGHHLGRRRRGAPDARRTSGTSACGSPSPTWSRRLTRTSAGSGKLVERTVRTWRGHGMKLGLTLPQGCDREYLGMDARQPGGGRSRSPSGPRTSASSRSGSTTTCGSIAARGGADLRAVRESWPRSPPRHAAPASDTSCSPRVLPEPRPDGQGDLDDRRDQRRPGDPRHRRRLEGGRVAGLRLRLPGRPRDSPSSPTSSRSSPGCSAPAGRRSRVSMPSPRRHPRAEGPPAAADPDPRRRQRTEGHVAARRAVRRRAEPSAAASSSTWPATSSPASTSSTDATAIELTFADGSTSPAEIVGRSPRTTSRSSAPRAAGADHRPGHARATRAPSARGARPTRSARRSGCTAR